MLCTLIEEAPKKKFITLTKTILSEEGIPVYKIKDYTGGEGEKSEASCNNLT